jgi:hypothetical protein
VEIFGQVGGGDTIAGSDPFGGFSGDGLMLPVPAAPASCGTAKPTDTRIAARWVYCVTTRVATDRIFTDVIAPRSGARSRTRGGAQASRHRQRALGSAPYRRWGPADPPRVTGVCRTNAIELVRSIGADHVIDYTREDFTDGCAATT